MAFHRPIPDSQPQGHQHLRALGRFAVVLLDGAEEGHLPGARIGDEQAVMPLRMHRAPQAIPDRQLLAVLGVTHPRCQRHLGGIMREQRVEVAIDEALEAGAIAARRLRAQRAGQQ